MAERPPLVATKSGEVLGFSDGEFVRWRGIPYARPPLGDLRLRAPRPPAPWRGVRHCQKFGFAAPQKRAYTLAGLGKFHPMSEDCLTLNVVAPAAMTDEPLPVLFWIHPGAYFLGSSAQPGFDGAALARRGCIFVSVNYRLGALGCMDLSSLSTPEVPIDGNLFLRDLVMALEWVRDNIAAFGGDPERVTICGVSAGGHAVTTLMAVPAARALFSGAIAQSTGQLLIKTAEGAAEFAQSYAALLGVGPGEAGAALQAADTGRLVALFDQLLDSATGEILSNVPLGPCVDGDYLPQDPFEAIAEGAAHPVPLIVGCTAHEASLFRWALPYLPTSAPLVERMLSGIEASLRDDIIAAYPNYPAQQACIQLSGDKFITSAMWRVADGHCRHAPTYVYSYDYAPRPLKWLGVGATHCSDLLALFGAYETKVSGLLALSGDRRAARRVTHDIQKRWCLFAGTGKPGSRWPAYTDSDPTVMIFDRTSHTENDPWSSRRSAWQKYPASG
ncbi:carboxylesterase/lipase family protein [Mycobacterium colombiense]